jgi:hypothetical protein
MISRILHDILKVDDFDGFKRYLDAHSYSLEQKEDFLLVIECCCDHDAISCFKMLMNYELLFKKIIKSWSKAEFKYIVNSATRSDSIKIFEYMFIQHYSNAYFRTILQLKRYAEERRAKTICDFLQMRIRKHKIKSL